MATATLTMDTNMHKLARTQRTAIQVAKMMEKLARQVQHSTSPRASAGLDLLHSLALSTKCAGGELIQQVSVVSTENR